MEDRERERQRKRSLGLKGSENTGRIANYNISSHSAIISQKLKGRVTSKSCQREGKQRQK